MHGDGWKRHDMTRNAWKWLAMPENVDDNDDDYDEDDEYDEEANGMAL